MVNYVLMMTWLPATVIIVEEMNMKLCKCWQSYVDAINVLIERFGNSMEGAIIRSVKKFKYVFLVIFCKFISFNPYLRLISVSKILSNFLLYFYNSFDWNFEWGHCLVLSKIRTTRFTNIPVAR